MPWPLSDRGRSSVLHPSPPPPPPRRLRQVPPDLLPTSLSLYLGFSLLFVSGEERPMKGR